MSDWFDQMMNGESMHMPKWADALMKLLVAGWISAISLFIISILFWLTVKIVGNAL